MKFIYYCIWFGLASVHYKVSSALFVINKVIFKVRKINEAEQNKWKDNYNKGFLDFPGGMIDWAAFGLLLTFIWIPIIIFSVTYGIPLFSSKVYFGILFVFITLFVYYWIYFKHISWIKAKIRKVNKRYYL